MEASLSRVTQLGSGGAAAACVPDLTRADARPLLEAALHISAPVREAGDGRTDGGAENEAELVVQELVAQPARS
jgi:hypothetical protein